MFLWLYIFVNLYDLAFWIDEERPTFGSHIFATHKLLLAPNAVSLHKFLVIISEKCERKFIFLNKLRVAFRGINTRPKHNKPKFLELRKVITNRTRFFGTSWCVVLWIKIQKHPFPFLIFEGMHLPELIG